jgi:hypothetical protein
MGRTHRSYSLEVRLHVRSLDFFEEMWHPYLASNPSEYSRVSVEAEIDG